VTCRSSSFGFGVGVATWVVAELGEHPGAENDPQAGLAQVDLSVRVLAKTRLHLPGQHLGLLGHRRQHHYQRRRAGRISRHHRGSGSQLL
jgi:hypothetical protein